MLLILLKLLMTVDGQFTSSSRCRAPHDREITAYMVPEKPFGELYDLADRDLDGAIYWTGYSANQRLFLLVHEDRHPNAAAGAVENGVAAGWVLAFNTCGR